MQELATFTGFCLLEAVYASPPPPPPPPPKKKLVKINRTLIALFLVVLQISLNHY